jgi:putative PIN family toxin of toxin-antitoxin system
MEELEKVLARRHVRRRIQWSPNQLNVFLGSLRRRTAWLQPQRIIEVLTADPDDNRVLEAAVEGDADYIVTGDRDLLELGAFEGVSIVTPRDFVAILAREANP